MNGDPSRVHQEHVAAPIVVSDYVADAEPSRFLRCAMSRRVSRDLVTSERLGPFLESILLQAIPDKQDALSTLLCGMHYAESSRRVVLLELATVEAASALQQALDRQPCELIEGRMLYVDYAMHRLEKEARDLHNSALNITRKEAMVNADGEHIPGLVFIPEWISKEEEQAIVLALDRDEQQHWRHDIRARQVQHFGFAFNYNTRRCDAAPVDEEMPSALETLVQRMPATIMASPDQMTVNEYLPGQGIAAHIDAHAPFGPAIACVSLLSELVMEFRHPMGQVARVLLPPRSLAVMTGAARYEWTHAIAARRYDIIDGQRIARQRRVSVTMRNTQWTPCTCDFPIQCVADREEQMQFGGQTPEENEKQVEEQKNVQDKVVAPQTDKGQSPQTGIAPLDTTGSALSLSRAPTQVEQEFVHDFYDVVARHFSSTRYNPWPRIKSFVQTLTSGAWLADIGCGNGKYMKCIDPHQVIAVGGDRSAELVKICAEHELNVMVYDALAVPIRSQCCDAALSIAVLHHLSTHAHRLAAVQEVIRVLRVGGRGVIYAWAHEQQAKSRRQFDSETQDYMVPWRLDPRFMLSKNNSEDSKSTSEHEEGKAQKQQPVIVQRFCHMFKQGELEDLVDEAGHAIVEDSYYDESNWAVILQRVD